MKRKIFTLLTLLTCVFGSAWGASVSDLVAITENYTFIADNITSNGTVKLTSNTLYEDGKIFSPKGNNVATNKGSNTFDGGSHLNSLRIKNTQDQLVFKVGGACNITFYTQSHGSRGLQVGTSEGGKELGVQTISTTEFSLDITDASTIYLSSYDGDFFIAGFKVTFPEAGTVTKPSITFDGTTLTMSTITEGADIYYTLDGTTPSSSSTKYTEPFTLENSCHVSAIAIKDEQSSDVVGSDYFVAHASAKAVLGYNGGTLNGDANVWTSTDGEYTLTDNTAGRTIGYANLAGSQDAFKLNANDSYTIQISPKIKVTKIVVVGRTWLTGSAATIAFDGFTPASGSFFDADENRNTYVKTIEFTPTSELGYGAAITMTPGVNQLGAYIEIYGDAKTPIALDFSATKSALNVGETTTTTIVPTYGAGESSSDYTIAYTTSNNGVATVAADGTIKATGRGTATITATVTPVNAVASEYAANTATVDVNVTDPNLDVDNDVRSWDFTNWSSETLAGIATDETNWSNFEKANETSDLTGKVWTTHVELSAGSTLKYGTTTIPETDGLTFSVPTHSMGIAYNLPETTLGTYSGSQFLWLYGKSSIITIPDVAEGSVITIEVESHKTAEGRGVDLKVGSTALALSSGEAKPTTKVTNTWNVTADGDVTITPNQGGCHIYSISVATPVEVRKMVVGAAGYATYSNTAEVTIPSGVEAYYAEQKDANTIVLKQITDGIIPANEGVVLKATAGTYAATASSTGKAKIAGNLLKPWTVAGEPADATYYTLAVEDSKPVFKQSTGGVLAAGKAYLVLPAGAKTLSVVFDGETTGISDASRLNNAENANDKVVFNLNGQRIAAPQKGINIINGKKIIVK